LVDYLAKDNKVGCNQWSRCQYSADEPVVKEFIEHSSNFFRMKTHCISKAVKSLGFWLDHSLALHPSISKIPARTAVGIIHHILYLIAWPAWRTEGVKSVDVPL